MKADYMFTLHGIIRSGKNHVQITRTGHRYPNKLFSLWRADMLSQIGPVAEPLLGPVSMIVDYVPGDLKRRDLSALLDGLFHVMEKAGILLDDAQVKNLQWHQFPMDRKAPKCRVLLTKWDGGEA